MGTQPVRPPREINPELPESIERLILRLLEKDPASRTQSAEELIAEIRRLESPPEQTAIVADPSLAREFEATPVEPAAQPAVHAAGRPPRNVRRIAIAAAAAAACILCGVFVLKIKHRDGTEESIPLKEGDSLTLEEHDDDAEQPLKNEPTADGSHPQSKSENPKPASDWRGWSTDGPEPAIAPFDAAQAKKRQQEWADHLKLPLEYTNSIGMKFVLIPPGEFTMGSTAEVIDEAMKVINRIIPDNKLWHEFVPSEAPPHKVVITRPFYLSVYEVTQHEYETVMGVNPSNFAKTSSGESSQKVAGLDTTSHPVENVRWNDAAEFCAKLSQKEEFKPFYSRSGETVAVLAGAGYRLPTEAEWEFACRAGTTAKSWAGDREQDLLSAGWFKENAGGRTHPVGQLASNPFGLFDVFGNVMEWVEDSWQPAFYEQFAGKLAVDPKCGLTSDPKRSFRGGAWYDIATFWRSATRFGDDPVERGDVGIRVVLMPDALRREAPAAEPRPDAERADAD